MSRRHRDEAWRRQVVERAVRRYSFAGRYDRDMARLSAACSAAWASVPDPLRNRIDRWLRSE